MEDFTVYEYEFTLWEKAENWKFYVTYKAGDRLEAIELMRRDYSIDDYRILNVHRPIA